jgi:hypothetical protein
VKVAAGVFFIVVVVAFASVPALGQQPASVHASARAKSTVPVTGTVLLSSDMDCSVRIDQGEAQSVSASKPTVLKVTLGEHLLTATSVDGKDVWRQVVNLDQPVQKVVLIALTPIQQAREKSEAAEAEVERQRAQKAAEEAQAAEQARQDYERMKREEAEKKAAEEARANEAQALTDEGNKLFPSLVGEWKGFRRWTRTGGGFAVTFEATYEFHFRAPDADSINADITAHCSLRGGGGPLTASYVAAFRYVAHNSLRSVAYKCMDGNYKDQPGCGRYLTGFVADIQPDGRISAAILSGSCLGRTADDGIILEKTK